jgi:hypothetical protein
MHTPLLVSADREEIEMMSRVSWLVDPRCLANGGDEGDEGGREGC